MPDKNKIIKRTKEFNNLPNHKIHSLKSASDFSSITRHIKDKYTRSLATKKINPLPKNLLIKHARFKLCENYKSNKETYNINIIDILLYNKNCHLVSVFKESMIMDYLEEFLKR